MPQRSEEIERIRQARRIFERMRGRLLLSQGDALESSASDLQLAADCLRKIDLSLKSPIWQGRTRQRIEPEVVALRVTIRSIQALLKNAGNFYCGLVRLLAPDEAPMNYTAAGAKAAVPRSARGSVVLHG